MLDKKRKSNNKLADLRTRFYAEIGDGLFGGFLISILTIIFFVIFVVPFYKSGEYITAKSYIEQISQKTDHIRTILFFVYSWILVGKYGWTLGKRYMNIKVVKAGTFEKIGLEKAFLREGLKVALVSITIIPFLNFLILLINIYLIGFTTKRQAIYDLVADTQVITIPSDKKKKKTLDSIATILIILLLITLGILFYIFFK